jgi:hypothetical protein
MKSPVSKVNLCRQAGTKHNLLNNTTNKKHAIAAASKNKVKATHSFTK